MRSAKIFYKDSLAGILNETNEGDYVFAYDQEYIARHPHQFLTFDMPVSGKPYIENKLHPFFEGLIPEGWLLEIASENWKINRNDRLGVLLACCKDCIGAVSVEPIPVNDEG